MRWRRKWWRRHRRRICARLRDALQSLLLRLLNTCAFAIVLVDAVARILVLALAFVGVLAFFALVGGCGVSVINDRFARMVVPNIQWQYSVGRLFPLDRLDTDFTQSLSVRKVRAWRRYPQWNLGTVYHTLKQPTLTNRVFRKRPDLAGKRRVDFCAVSVQEHHLWARRKLVVGSLERITITTILGRYS